MKYFVNGQEYKYITDGLKDTAIRMGYFQLTKQIYGLEFEKWHQSGYWGDRFIPYIMMHEGVVVSSVAVCINDINWQGNRKRYVQISTVMTLPAYRNKGLNRYLMDAVLSEWEDKCDAIYLLANDSVVNFYPKFGFEAFKEFQYSKPIIKSNGVILNILNIMANESAKVAYLGFTPKSKEHYIIEESQEPDTHLFVFKGKENIFKDNRVMFPMLSRA